MKKIAFFIGLLAFTTTLPLAGAQARSIWNVLFPYFTEPEPEPEVTLKAPFATDAKSQPKSDLSALYDENHKTDSLDQPHRQTGDIERWLENAIPEIFSIDDATYEDHLKHLRTGMNETAMSGYTSFVQQGNILAILSSNNMKLTGFADGKPVLLNEGAVEGRYRWLFEVPVTLSYIPKNQKTYKGASPQAQKATVNVQVGRVPQGQGSDEMMIETFDLKARAE